MIRFNSQVVQLIYEIFAGEPHRGIYSPSVQQSMYLMEKQALLQVPQMEWIWMAMPNKHYFPVDLSK